MLVLSRKRGEAIVIAEDIEIIVIDVQGKQVRLGITAPRDIEITRKESNPKEGQ